MQLVGTWESTGLPDRQLVFLEDGTGYISVQTVRHPYSRWWYEQGIAHWLLLVFKHAPIPFGLKRFRLVSTTNARV